MTLFHLPTFFLIIGVLYFMMPVITWFVLAGHRTLAVKLWCGGGILLGLSFTLVALRGHVPAWATFPLANLLAFAYGIVRIQSLRLDLAVPWRWQWMAVATLLFVLVLESIRLGLGNLTLMAIYNFSIYSVLSAYLAALALRLANQEQSLSVRWIAYAYFSLAGATLYNVAAFSIGWSSPLPNALDSSPGRLITGIVALPGVVIAHIAYIGFILERTNRQRVEINARYDELVSRIPVGIYTLRLRTDGALSFEYCSEKFCQILGANERDVLRDAESVFGIIHPDDRASLDKANQYAAQTLEPFRWEGRFLLVGDTRWLRIESEPTLLPNGDSLWNGVLIDVTEKKETVHQLRLTQFAVEHTLDVVFLVREDASFQFINDAGCRKLEYSREELLTMTVADIDPIYNADVWHERWQALKEAGSLTIETLHRTRSGRVFPVEVHTNFIEYDGVEYNCGIGRDMTERKQAEESLRESEVKFRLAFTNANTGMCLVDLQGNLLQVNEKMSAIFGYSKHELESMSVNDLALPDDKRISLEFIHHAIEGCEDNIIFEKHYRHRLGNTISCQVSSSLVRDAQGQPHYFISQVQDITEKKLAEESLKGSEERLRLITDIAPVFLAEIDKELCYRFVNRRYADMFGLPPGEFCGKHVSAMISEQVFAKVQPYMLKALTGQPVEFETGLNETPEGYKFVAARYAPRYDDTGQIIGFVAAINDITERKRAEEEIKQLAFYDTLTQLPNRRLLLDRLQQAMVNSDRNKTHGALLFIDLDNFKTLNDTLGHDKGDLLLQQVASRIVSCVRESDTVARLGGDEFVVMLTGLVGNIKEAAAQAQKIGWKIIDTLNQTYSLAGYEHYCSASMGITLFAGQGSTIDELLKQADIAMYQAKTAGRNTLCFFDPHMQSSITARATLSNDLHRALEKNQFELFFQIEVGHNQQAVGAEALLRWNHPERGLILPQEFIPLAEETVLIQPIGQWVLESACALLKSWDKSPQWQHLYLAVNISARQFQQPNFVDKVFEILRETGADPGRLMLELAENVVLADLNQAIAVMSALKEGGVRFSLDHSGTGLSSLAHIVRLPFDQMKIDRSFVQNIVVKPSDAAIIETIMVMAEKLGIAIVAEGVETEVQRAFLEKYGCPVCQGYLFGKPMPLAEFERQFTL